MGSSTRSKYSNIALRILNDNKENIQSNGKGLAYAMQGVLRNGNSGPRKKLSKLATSEDFKKGVTSFYTILHNRKPDLRNIDSKKYNIIVDEIIEESNFQFEYQRIALKKALRKVDFNQEFNIWDIINNFFKILLRMFFSEAVIEPVSDTLENKIDEEIIEEELNIIEGKIDSEIDRDDTSSQISESDVEKELIDFTNRVKLAFGGRRNE